jgi:hypothetical protein
MKSRCPDDMAVAFNARRDDDGGRANTANILVLTVWLCKSGRQQRVYDCAIVSSATIRPRFRVREVETDSDRVCVYYCRT